VLIEIAAGFDLPRAFERALVLGLTVGKTIGVGMMNGKLALGSLAGRSKVDQFSHAAPRR
jgi:hypothetical protein